MSESVLSHLRQFARPSSILIVAVVAVAVGSTMDSYYVYLGTLLGAYCLIAMGLNLLVGYGGIASLAQGALAGLGAYVTAILMVDYSWNFFPALLVAVIVTVLVGSVLTLPALRLSSWYFTLVTLALAQLFEVTLVEFRGLTHGYAGIIGIPSPSVFGYVLDERQLFWMIVLGNVGAFLGIRRVIGSPFGRALIASRDVPDLAAASGASLVRVKVITFAMSAALAGLAGGFIAVNKAVLTPDDFNTEFSILLLVAVLLGGRGTLWGPIAGVLVFYGLPEFMGFLLEWRMLVYGILLILVFTLAPSGLVGIAQSARERLGRRRAEPPGDPGPTLIVSASEQLAPPARTGVSIEVEGICKSFGGVAALHDVDMVVPASTLHGLIGPNGSGKTTLLNIMSGFLAQDSGSVRIGGVDRSLQKAHIVARAGLARTFQTPQLVPELSVLDNVRIGLYARPAEEGMAKPIARGRRKDRQDRAAAYELLDRLGLADIAGLRADSISHGQQRLVDIARATASAPVALLMDEPAAGLSGDEIDRLLDLVTLVHQMDLTILIVEHHMDVITALCDNLTVLSEGRVIASGSLESALSDSAVIDAYTGGGVR